MVSDRHLSYGSSRHTLAEVSVTDLILRKISKFPKVLGELSMCKQCVPGSFFSVHALEPGNEAKWHPAHITSSVEWRSNRARIIRCLQHRCDNRCIALTCCIVCLGLIAIIFLLRSKWQIIDTPMSYHACPIMLLFSYIALGKFDLHWRLNRDTEQEIAVPYGISREIKLLIKQELLLWLSCFIICTPWILAQCETTHLWYSLLHHTQALGGGLQI